jgi:predicted N-acetyltransferase YhbS
MNCSDMLIRPETAGDLAEIDHLHDEAFGPGRFAKTAYRVREGVPPVDGLSLVAQLGADIAGSLRFTAVRIGGGGGALLLGPLAVHKRFAGHRCGLRLMEEGLTLARLQGFRLVLLVGDLPYYRKVGFVPVPVGQIGLPGPVDYTRLFAFELVAGALAEFHGMMGV